MTSPFQRTARRSTHLTLVANEIEPAPRSREGFLISDKAYKSGAVIDYTVRGFDHPLSNRRVVVSPGFGGIKPAYGDFRDAMAEELNGDTASYRQPRTERGLRGFTPDKLKNPHKLGKQAVVAMIDVMRERYPDQKVTLIGHSMGGPNAVDAALRRLDDVEDIILLGSGGLEEGQNVARIAARLPKVAAREGRSVLNMPRKDSLSMLGQAAFHMARNPHRTIGEARDIGSRNIMVEEISALQAHNIGVHAVQLEHDEFFPTDIAEQHAGWLVDSFSVIAGADHLAPQTEPQMVAEHIASILNLADAPELKVLP